MPGWSYATVWSGIAAAVPERDALICGERRVTWGAFADRARRLATHLFDAGIRPGDKVAIDVTNRPEYLETLFAAWLIGAVPANVNYRYLADEVRYVLDNSDARALVHDPAFATVAHDAIAGLPEDQRPVVVLETGPAYEAAVGASEPDGNWANREPDGDDLLFLFITLSTLAGAGTAVLVEQTGLDPELLWSEIERNDVAVLTTRR